MEDHAPSRVLEAAIRTPKRGSIALMPYLTAGYPELQSFAPTVSRLAEVADAIEIGVPFSDPMADGATIQESSRVALENGVSLRWILAELGTLDGVAAPLVLMSYLNPLLAYGLRQVVRDAAQVGVTGFIVPDLPLEESSELRRLAGEQGLAVIQLVTPVTSPERRRRLVKQSAGFIYAVTVTGITGGSVPIDEVRSYLDTVRAVSELPVCAGFGIRTREHLAALEGHADGAIVGSALIDVMAGGGDVVGFLESLRSP